MELAFGWLANLRLARLQAYVRPTGRLARGLDGPVSGCHPPMEWIRRVKGLTSEIKYRAGKPSGEPRSDDFPLEYFTIKEWLVIGP